MSLRAPAGRGNLLARSTKSDDLPGDSHGLRPRNDNGERELVLPVGDGHDPPAEKRSFSVFPKENKPFFALRRQILLWQNLRAGHDPPLQTFIDKLKKSALSGGFFAFFTGCP